MARELLVTGPVKLKPKAESADANTAFQLLPKWMVAVGSAKQFPVRSSGKLSWLVAKDFKFYVQT